MKLLDDVVSSKRNSLFFWYYMRKHKVYFIFLFLIVIFRSSLLIYLPVLLSNFIDNALMYATHELLVKVVIYYGIISVAVIILSIIITYLSEVIGWKSTNELRKDLIDHYLKLDTNYTKSIETGYVLNIINKDSSLLHSFFSSLSVFLTSNILQIVGVIIISFSRSVLLGFVQIIFIIIAFLVLSRIKNKGVEHWKTNREIESKFFGFVGDSIANLDTVKGIKEENYVKNNFNTIMREWFPIQKKITFIMWLPMIFILVLQILGYTLFLGLGTYLWIDGVITIGTIYLFYTYINFILNPIMGMQSQIQELQSIGAAIFRVKEFFGNGVTEHISERNIKINDINKLEFRSVSFAYDADYVLENINLSIENNEKVSIAGRTGVGKSTMLSLIMKLYTRYEGEILINGLNIIDINTDSLRRQISYISQDSFQFDDSLRNNISIFNSEISDELILDSITTLGLTKWFESFKEGLDTKIGEGNRVLSESEKQYLQVIRVFLKNPSVLIFDELGSEFDIKTRDMINQLISKVIDKKIVISVTHHTDNYFNFDRTFIIENGNLSTLK